MNEATQGAHKDHLLPPQEELLLLGAKFAGLLTKQTKNR